VIDQHMIYDYLGLGNHVGEFCESANMSMIGHECGDIVETPLTFGPNRAHLSPPSPLLTEIEAVDLILSKTEAQKADAGCLQTVPHSGHVQLGGPKDVDLTCALPGHSEVSKEQRRTVAPCLVPVV
jgi:hypothetical protein